MDKYFDSTNLTNIVYKWKIHLIVIVGIAAILAGIFSGPAFITPLYKSTAILYPANINAYSEESETEQMLQIMMSQEIVDSMIKKFDLAKHYEINPRYKYFKTVLLGEYHDKVSISKTPYEAVQIKVEDRNPDTAAMMVNAIIKFYDKKVDYLHKSKYREVVDMYERQLARKRRILDSLKNIMYKLGTENGIFEYDYQSQQIMRAYLGSLGGNPSKIKSKEVKRLVKGMQEHSGQLVEVVEMIQDEAANYVDVKQDYELAQRFVNSNLTYSNVVSYPYVPDKKSYPIRWLFVVGAALAAFVFALFIIFWIERKKIKE
jgi:capsular polysaccharide biosynthesis protein